MDRGVKIPASHIHASACVVEEVLWHANSGLLVGWIFFKRRGGSWLGGRDSNPDTVVQRADYRYQYASGRSVSFGFSRRCSLRSVPLRYVRVQRVSLCLRLRRRLVGASEVFRPHLHAFLSDRFPKLHVERRDDDLRTDGLLPRERGRELNGVIAAKRVIPRKCFGSCDERVAHWNPRKIQPLSSERALGFPCIFVR
jgi:hypothetical protein